VHAQVVSGERDDTVLLLEHEPVYTAGKRTNSWDRPLPGVTATPVIDVDRGGKITWHGPGQLVGYPIVRLPDPVDVVAFVRRVEQLLIAVCDQLGVPTARVARAQRRQRAGPVLHDRPVRHQRRWRHVTAGRAPAADHHPRCRPFGTGAPAAADDSVTGEGSLVSVTPDGRRLLRLEVRNSQTPIERKPPWIKTRMRTGPEYRAMHDLVQREGLHTVCQEAGCPNIYECWEDREATFLIGGEQCTRRCDFCQIDTGRPADLDRDEPRRVADSVRVMGLRYATVTGVARDDLPDQGAWLYAETVRQIHAVNPGTGVELLAPDFNRQPDLLSEVFATRPEVFAHNLETVPRIFKRIRPAFRFDRSLGVLADAREAGMLTKSNLILGLGETDDEVHEALVALREVGCQLLTITQYLRPSPRHHPVDRWVTPEEFAAWEQRALAVGFAGVMSGPLVRSSYRAGRLYRQFAAALPR